MEDNYERIQDELYGNYPAYDEELARKAQSYEDFKKAYPKSNEPRNSYPSWNTTTQRYKEFSGTPNNGLVDPFDYGATDRFGRQINNKLIGDGLEQKLNADIARESKIQAEWQAELDRRSLYQKRNFIDPAVTPFAVQGPDERPPIWGEGQQPAASDRPRNFDKNSEKSPHKPDDAPKTDVEAPKWKAQPRITEFDQKPVQGPFDWTANNGDLKKAEQGFKNARVDQLAKQYPDLVKAGYSSQQIEEYSQFDNASKQRTLESYEQSRREIYGEPQFGPKQDPRLKGRGNRNTASDSNYYGQKTKFDLPYNYELRQQQLETERIDKASKDLVEWTKNKNTVNDYREGNPRTVFNDDQILKINKGENLVYGPNEPIDLEKQRRMIQDMLNQAAKPKPKQGVSVGITNEVKKPDIPGNFFGEGLDKPKPIDPNNDPAYGKWNKSSPKNENGPSNRQGIIDQLNRQIQGRDGYTGPKDGGNGNDNHPKAGYGGTGDENIRNQLKGPGNLLQLPKQQTPKQQNPSSTGYGGDIPNGGQGRLTRNNGFSPDIGNGIKGGYQTPKFTQGIPDSFKPNLGQPINRTSLPLPMNYPRESKRLGILGLATDLIATYLAYEDLEKTLDQREDLKRRYGIGEKELRAIESEYEPRRNLRFGETRTYGDEGGRPLVKYDGDYDRYNDFLGLEQMIRSKKRGMSPAAFRKQFERDNGTGRSRMPLGPYPDDRPEDYRKPLEFKPMGDMSKGVSAIQRMLDEIARRLFRQNKGHDWNKIGEDYTGKTIEQIEKIERQKRRKSQGLPEDTPFDDRPYDPENPDDQGNGGGGESPFPACMSFGLGWYNKKDPKWRGHFGFIPQPSRYATLYGVDRVFEAVATDSNRSIGNGTYETDPFWLEHTLFNPPSGIFHFFGSAGTMLEGELKGVIKLPGGAERFLVNTIRGMEIWIIFDYLRVDEVRYTIIRDNRVPESPYVPVPPLNPEDPEGEPMSNCRYMVDIKSSVTLQSYVEATGLFSPTPIPILADMAPFAMWISGELQKMHRKIGNTDKYLEASKNVENPLPINAPMAEMMGMQAVIFGQLPNADFAKNYVTKFAPGKTLMSRIIAQSSIAFSFAGHHQYGGMRLKSNMLDPKSQPAKITTAFDFAVHSFSNLGGMIGLPNALTVNGQKTAFKNASDGIETANAKVANIEQDVASLLAMVNAIAKNQEIQNGFLVHANADIEMLVKDGGFKFKNKMKEVPSLFTQSKPNASFTGNFLEKILTPLKNQRIVREWDEKADKLQLGRHTNVNAQIAASAYKIEIASPSSGGKPQQETVIPLLSNSRFQENKGKKSSANDKWRRFVATIENPASTLQKGMETPKIKEFFGASVESKSPGLPAAGLGNVKSDVRGLGDATDTPGKN